MKRTAILLIVLAAIFFTNWWSYKDRDINILQNVGVERTELKRVEMRGNDFGCCEAFKAISIGESRRFHPLGWS